MTPGITPFRMKTVIFKKSVGGLQNYLQTCSANAFIGWGILLYLSVTGLNLATHEMWRDELQAWLIARGSNTICELFLNFRYEPHPALWFLLLYPLSKITHNAVAMQLLHLAIATGTAYIFLKFAPFTRLQKLLFIFGYFLIYEYAAISRNYALGIFFIFLFCALFNAGPRKNYLKLSAVLFLLAQTNAYAFMITIALSLMLVLEFLFDKEVRVSLSDKRWEIFFSAWLAVFGLFIAVATITSKSDCGFATEWTYKFDLKRVQETLQSILRAFMPIPRMGTHFFWNTNVLHGKILPRLLVSLLLCFLLFSFIRKRLILFLFSFFIVEIMAFQYFKHPGYLRHHGYIFILFIACLWLSGHYEDDRTFKLSSLAKIADWCVKYKNWFLNILLSVHLIAGIFVSGMDWFYPFSEGKAVAQYIKNSKMENLPILGDVDTSASTVAGYLNRPIYYPRGDRYGTFIFFDKKQTENISESSLFEKARLLARNRKSDILLVLNYKLKTDSDSILKLKEFDRSIVADENFYLYLFKYSDKEGGN